MAGFFIGQFRNQSARIIDIDSIILGEYAENEVRKDFTVSERVAIGEAVEAELGNRQGQRTDLRPRRNLDEVSTKRTDEIAAEKAELGERRGRPSNNVQNFAQLNDEVGHKTIEIAAQKSGFRNKETY